jgi:hypothetical protein
MKVKNLLRKKNFKLLLVILVAAIFVYVFILEPIGVFREGLTCIPQRNKTLGGGLKTFCPGECIFGADDIGKERGKGDTLYRCKEDPKPKPAPQPSQNANYQQCDDAKKYKKVRNETVNCLGYCKNGGKNLGNKDGKMWFKCNP